MTPVLLRVLFGTCLLLAVSAWDLPTLFGRDLADNNNDDKRTSPPRPNKGLPGCNYCGLLDGITSCGAGEFAKMRGPKTVEAIETVVCGHSEDILLCVDRKSMACGAEARSRRGSWLRRSFDIMCDGASFKSDLREWLRNRYMPFVPNAPECNREVAAACVGGKLNTPQVCEAPTEVLGGIQYRAMRSKIMRCMVGAAAANPKCSLRNISTFARVGEFMDDIIPGSV